MPDPLKDCQKKLKLKFKHPLLLQEALTHDSYRPELGEEVSSNQRLEFLGDSVLGVLVAEELFLRFPHLNEGELALLKSNLVNTGFLAQKALELDLNRLIRIGKNDEERESPASPSVLADCFEAVLGAVFLDRGIKACKKFILKLFSPELSCLEKGAKDCKSLLQELTQKHYKILPLYKVIKEKGPPHQKIFTIQVSLEKEKLAKATGKSKKEAQQNAAGLALEVLIQRLAEESLE